MSDDNDFEDGQNDGRSGYIDEDRYQTSPDYKSGHDSGACFAGSTEVWTPFGSRCIDSFKVGDIVLAWSEERQAIVEQPIRKVNAHAPTRIVQLRFRDGTQLRATVNHKLMTQDGWKRIDKMVPSEQLWKATGISTRLDAVIALPEKEPVFNLLTRYEHSYVVNGFIAHSFSFMRSLRHFVHRKIEKAEEWAARGNHRPVQSPVLE